MSTHTPGPWRFDHDWSRIPTIFDAKGAKVASIEKGDGYKGTDRPDRLAIALLIAAAPDLLAELRNSPCPGGGYTGQPSYELPTVQACLNAGVCGCSAGDAVRKAEPPR